MGSPKGVSKTPPGAGQRSQDWSAASNAGRVSPRPLQRGALQAGRAGGDGVSVHSHSVGDPVGRAGLALSEPSYTPAFIPPLTAGWCLEVLEAPKDVVVRAGTQARFTCVLSEALPVGEATWYINGTAVLPDNDWTVTADGSHHTLLLHNAQLHHAGEVTFAARDAVTSARLSVLGGWFVCVKVCPFSADWVTPLTPGWMTILGWVLL